MTIRSMFERGLATAVLLALQAALPANAAAETACANETLSAGNYAGVVVVPGTSCTLESNVVVDGNVTAVDALDVVLDGVVVRGNVRIKRSAGATIDIRNSLIEGNLKLLDSQITGTVYVVDDNTVFGSIIVKRNSAGAFLIGSREQGGNVVGGHLKVKDNYSSIYIAANNSDVEGNVTVSGNYAVEDIIVWDNRVLGNLKYVDNVSDDTVYPEFVNSVLGNATVGDVVVRNNATVDPIEVSGNLVTGNLTCRDNDPAFISVVEPNVVEGDAACDG